MTQHLTAGLRHSWAEHEAGHSTRRLQVSGIKRTLARTWPAAGNANVCSRTNAAHGADARHATPGPDHAAERKEMDSMKEPQNSDRKEPQDKGAQHPLAGTRRPDYVIELWVAKELRDRVRRNGISLAEALEVGKEQDHGPADPELEDRKQSDHHRETASQAGQHPMPGTGTRIRGRARASGPGHHAARAATRRAGRPLGPPVVGVHTATATPRSPRPAMSPGVSRDALGKA